jgi:hypothetical protein
MVLLAGGLVGAVVVGFTIKERFFDGRDHMIDVELVGAPCMDGVLDPMIAIKISGDDWYHQQAFGGGRPGTSTRAANLFSLTVPPGELDQEWTIQVGVCKSNGPTQVDCSKPQWIGGQQTAKLDRTHKIPQLRVMFPGDLVCRR